MDLDDLIAEMTSGSPPPAQPSSSDSSSEEGGGKSFTLEDLDSLMAEVESSETSRRRQPTLVDAKKVGARKTTTRKTVQGALSGQDLDTILDTIMGAASKKLDQHKSALGWGVVSTDRKFDLRAPEATSVGEVCKCTLIVTLKNGERTRVPVDAMKIEFLGQQVRSTFEDNGDGTYLIQFIPPNLGKIQINIDAYGERQFEWQIDVCSAPDPSTCTAVLLAPPKVNYPVNILITASDSRGNRFKVGGANFQLGFAGVGQLLNVSLDDNLDGTYSLTATPNSRGDYMIYISLGDVDIKASPVQFNVT